MKSLVAVVISVAVSVAVVVAVARLSAADSAAWIAESGRGAPARMQVILRGLRRMSTEMSTQSLCMQVTREGRKVPEELPARQRQARSEA